MLVSVLLYITKPMKSKFSKGKFRRSRLITTIPMWVLQAIQSDTQEGCHYKWWNMNHLEERTQVP